MEIESLDQVQNLDEAFCVHVLGKLWILLSKRRKNTIYIYICVCLCVCVCERERERERKRERERICVCVTKRVLMEPFNKVLLATLNLLPHLGFLVRKFSSPKNYFITFIFGLIPFGKAGKTPHPSCYGLDSITAILQQGWCWH